MEAMKDYVAHLDNKKRITLRGAAYQYYNVKEYGNDQTQNFISFCLYLGDDCMLFNHQQLTSISR